MQYQPGTKQFLRGSIQIKGATSTPAAIYTTES